MTHSFPYSRKLEEFTYPGMDIVRNGDWIDIETDMTRKETIAILKKTRLIEDAPTLKLDVSLDCPNCAAKIERELNRNPRIEKARFHFADQEIEVSTFLSREDVIEICREIDDEIGFPDGRTEAQGPAPGCPMDCLHGENAISDAPTLEFHPSIDCPVCAGKVESGLNAHEGIEKAVYNFSMGKLRVTTRLSREKVIGICREISDEIEFPEEEGQCGNDGRDWKDYSFKAVIDCAACAAKVERKLSSTEGIRNVSFNFEKSRLTLSSTLSRNEIERICRNVEDDIGLYDENVYEYGRKLSSGSIRKLASHDGIASVEKKGGHLFITSSLERKKVDSLVRSMPETDWTLYRILLSVALFIFSELSGIGLMAIASYLVAGYDILYHAFRNILRGHVFDENFLMSIATLGALMISSYEEAAGVMIFYQIGEYFQKKALGRSRENISSLMDLTEDEVTVIENGTTIAKRAEDVRKGERILIHAGEKISIDGLVLEGTTSVDEKSITGESIPRNVRPGDTIPSGAVNGDGVITVEATTDYSDSTAMRIVRLINDGEEKKAKSEKFITRFSRWYTPAVCIITLLVAFVPPLFFGGIWRDWIYRGLMLLVISCPCALVLSVPLTYFASIGSFARHGILVKNAESIEKLAGITTMAFDKTGTLTEGNFHVTHIDSGEMERERFITIASSLEDLSRHPIAKAVAQLDSHRMPVSGFHEIPGHGIEGTIDGTRYFMGRKDDYAREGLAISLQENGIEIGYLIVEDTLKENASDTVSRLKSHGIGKTVMLSGDRYENAVSIAHRAGIDEVRAPLLPQEKLEELEKLIESDRMVAYVGDGINDAPGLVRADVGISMGAIGSDAAIEASDCVIMNDNLDSLDDAVAISRKTERIVHENIWLSLIVKLAVMVLGIAGLANMWMAVFADTGVAFLATLNAMRALRYRRR